MLFQDIKYFFVHWYKVPVCMNHMRSKSGSLWIIGMKPFSKIFTNRSTVTAPSTNIRFVTGQCIPHSHSLRMERIVNCEIRIISTEICQFCMCRHAVPHFHLQRPTTTGCLRMGILIPIMPCGQTQSLNFITKTVQRL